MDPMWPGRSPKAPLLQIAGTLAMPRSSPMMSRAAPRRPRSRATTALFETSILRIRPVTDACVVDRSSTSSSPTMLYPERVAVFGGGRVPGSPVDILCRRHGVLAGTGEAVDLEGVLA